MAAGTGDFDMRPGQLKNELRMVKGGRLPGGGGMALGAVLAEQSLMDIIFGVAVITTVGRPACREPLGVALGAGQFGVGAGQREGGRSMVEGGRLPGGSVMADRTILAKLPLVRIVFGVAVKAAGRRLGQPGA